VPIVLKSGSLNFLEPSGPVQACNGITLPSTVIIFGWVGREETKMDMDYTESVK
jgi:hypothetical protein